MKKFAVIAASLSAAVLAGSLMTSASAQTIKIGVIEPLTGPFAASGNYVTNGAKIAADEINAKGDHSQSQKEQYDRDGAGRNRPLALSN